MRSRVGSLFLIDGVILFPWTVTSSASPAPAQEAAAVREDKKNQIIQLLKSKNLSSRDGAFGFSQYPYQLFISELKEKLNINPEEGYALFMELVGEKKIKAMFVRSRPTYIFSVTVLTATGD